MLSEVQTLVNDYSRWLRDKTKLREVNGHVEITTPYLDRHSDHLQIYATSRDGGFLLTDDGYTINDLEMSGLTFSTPRREQLLRQTLNGFGVQLNEGALEIAASRENFARKKHCLMQTMLAINDLFYLVSPIVHSLFLEDVVQWMDLSDIRYTPNVKFAGKSGFDHVFDFVVPKSRCEPERVIRAINKPNRDNAQTVAFAWTDTKDGRDPEAQAFAILNDADHKVSGAVIDALNSYGVKVLLWSQREEFKVKLAA